MAELLFKQGQVVKALGIYRSLVRQRPDDEALFRRLNELEQQLAIQRGGRMSFREQLQRIMDEVSWRCSRELSWVSTGSRSIRLSSLE